MMLHRHKIFRSATVMLQALLILVLATGFAIAASDKKEGKDQARRLQQKINVLEQQNSQLIQAKSQLEGQIKEVTDHLNRAKHSIEAANRKGASLDQELKKAEDDKAELAGKLSQSEQKLTEAEEALRVTQAARNQLEANLSERNQDLSTCTTKNESLHRVGVELIKKYQEKSCLSSVLQNEPLTQLKSAEAENMLDEYREKLDQELVNQQQAGLQNPPQQKAEAQKAEAQKAEAQKAEAQKIEPVMVEAKKAEQSEYLKVKQQDNLDGITRKVKKFFENMEW
jgi:septal ring factor EnvC (AmiA/AmiB activator)